MGFPIRKSTDQRVFAPPRSLSQRITSFIACACQGIHQLPLRHLIVLIANAHPDRSEWIGTKRPASRDLNGGAVRQPIICKGLSVPGDKSWTSTHARPASRSLHATHAQTMKSEQIFSLRCHTEQAESFCFPQTFFSQRMTGQISSQHQRNWWSQTGSNRRPHACKARALPAELWPLIRKLVGLGGLEPPTSRLSSARSNQLSYKPSTTPSQQPLTKRRRPKARVGHSRRKRNEGGRCHFYKGDVKFD